VSEGRVGGRPARGEVGFVATELAAGVALLVLPVALLVLSLPGWVERQSTARLAAREVARAATLAGVCDPGLAQAIAADIAASFGVPATDVRAALDCEAGAALPRDGALTARVTIRMPALEIPVLGGVAAWEWTVAHVEPVDPYGSRP